MTPAQRDLILAALGLRPRNGRMPRWSNGNHHGATHATWPEWMIIERRGWAKRGLLRCGLPWEYPDYHVTRAGAEAAGVLWRVRKEDLGR